MRRRLGHAAHGASGKADDLVTRIGEFLRRRGAPESSRRLVEVFLRMASTSEEQATRLLRPLLEPAGLGYRDGEGWSHAATSSRATAAAPGRTESGSPGSQGPAPGSARVGVVIDPESWSLFAHEAGAEGPLAASEIRWPETVAVVPDSPSRGRLHAWLAERRLPAPARIIPLRRAVRDVVKLPREVGLDAICAALGVRWLDTGDAAGIAAAMASCLVAAAARREEMGLSDDGDAGGARGVEELVLPGTITADQLLSLPESPGVYRFFDRDDQLLYVGKASNLKRRVSSYFSGRRAGHGARFLDRIHRLEYDELPSELEALLQESKQIRGRRPKGNVQFEVHERPHAVLPLSAARCLALLLPSGERGTVTAVLVRDGRYFGHVRVGPQGGGLARYHRLLGRAVCARKGASSRAMDRETQILSTWLARHGDSISRLDLGDCTKAAQAADRLRAAARSMRHDAGRTDYR